MWNNNFSPGEKNLVCVCAGFSFILPSLFGAATRAQFIMKNFSKSGI
jgi:hypothetical protein